MTIDDGTADVYSLLRKKFELKSKIYENTYNVFQEFKSLMHEMDDQYRSTYKKDSQQVPFEFRDKSEFELELKFGSDILIFMMHTNVFEFSRDHEVMKTPYIREELSRSYCGVINIYNFLADSFKYNRVNDIGYLIGRVFVNRELHYFIEGKREIGMLYNNFATSVINRESALLILESAIRYTVNFDLLTPPYDSVKEVSVLDMQTTLDNMKLQTGKRLGFKFQADKEETKY
ncbi:MAG TPA: hypothetical protein VF298_07255 [Bacteroidales bacterium]|jgi:hypothetical protein